MTKLDAAKLQRETIDKKLTAIEAFVANFDSSKQSLNLLKARLFMLTDISAQYEDAQSQIDQYDKTTPMENHTIARLQFTDRWCEISASINDIIDANSATISGSGVQTDNQTKQVETNKQINLPVLNLKTFKGSYKQWSNFENSFKSIIDENKSLNDRQRFQYLLSCLEEEALRAIQTLSIDEKNYKEAWKILEKRFKNTRLIVQDHIHSILHAPSVLKSNHTHLRELLDVINSNVNSLKALDIAIDTWDAVMVPIISEKIDYQSRREWEMSLYTSVPKYETLIQFLEKRCSVLQALSVTTSKVQFETKPNFSKQNQFHGNKLRTVAHTSINKYQSAQCVFCKDSNHKIGQCSEFAKMHWDARSATIKRLKLCSNCLRDNHILTNCRSPMKCRVCNEKHHTMLHKEQQNTDPEATSTINNHALNSSGVLLSTAVILIRNHRNEYRPCRVLLDGGSMSNFITADKCKELGLKPSQSKITIKGVNGTASVVNRAISAHIKSRFNSFSEEISCLVVESVTEKLPPTTLQIANLEIPRNIRLADPKFYESSTIDLLLGAGLFYKLLCVGQISTNTGLIFQKTLFGFIAGGTYNATGNDQIACNLATIPRVSLDQQLERFWEIENNLDNNGTVRSLTKEEAECETQFRENTTRDSDGRFVVKLPIKDGHLNIGETKSFAVNRFYTLERKLSKNQNLKRQYSEFMSDYLNLSHMEVLTDESVTDVAVYLPHHAVIKESSTTSKLRTVFDASMKSSNSLSLNDNLLAGPTIQSDLFTVLIGFRTFQFVLNADIAKMYRQIRVHPEHTNCQLIFWRENPQEDLRTFKLTTLTYGTKPASFIATRCLKELAEQNCAEFPKASHIIKKHFYIDDLLTGADSEQELRQIQRDITHILRQGQFELRKFQSNSAELLNALNADFNAVNDKTNVHLIKEDFSKTLGLFWSSSNDKLKFEINFEHVPRRLTKRIMLSLIARMFDPLGLIGPVIMKAKILMQKLWALKIDWDESLPTEIHSSLISFLTEVHCIKTIDIERKVISCFPSNVKLHGFCDASQLGYGAAIYLRTRGKDDNFETSLLCSKSRVAPIKPVTLPRLELCGALLLARLFQKVKLGLNSHLAKEVFWTDSTIVLAWIHTPANCLKTFVANRVAEIGNLTSASNWRHIKGKLNPADTLSRGVSPSELKNDVQWFSGPSFLKSTENHWPSKELNINKAEIPETVVTYTVAKAEPESELLKKFSSFEKLTRVISWLTRFLYNARTHNKDKKRTGNLTTEELRKARVKIFRLVQKSSFKNELLKLQNFN